MSYRDQLLITLREETIGTINSESSLEEKFQNQTLRPVLKLQNDLLVQVFANHMSAYKNDFQNYSTQQKFKSIENAIQKDIKFKNLLIGIVIGQFTIDEYSAYIKIYSSLNKRIINMLIERLKSQIQIFETTDTNNS
mgnify:CR=1 FL=1